MPPRIIPKNKVATFSAYLYLLRVQLFVSVAVFALPIVALWWPVFGSQSLLENLFVEDRWGVFLSTLAAALVAWSVVLTSRLVLLNGNDRFGVEQAWRENDLKPRWIGTACAIIVAPLVCGQYYAWRHLHIAAEVQSTWWVVFLLGVGLLGAYLAIYIALLVAVLIAPVGTFAAAKTFPSPWPLDAGLAAADQPGVWPWLEGIVGALGSFLKKITVRLPDDLSDGYIDNRERFAGKANPGFQLPWSGHFISLAFAVITAVIYLGIGWAWHVNEDIAIPALTFLLLLLLIINWIVSFATFFIDRFRIPLLVPIVCLALFAGNCGRDHLFETRSDGVPSELSPSVLVETRADDNPAPIVVIATAGGGIQAAAWTARVLTGLQQDSLRWPAPFAPFAPRVALVSAVSGGAVGSMFFLNEYRSDPGGDGFNSSVNLEAIVDHAEAPALDEVGYSLVYNDLPRMLLPWPGDSLFDRGRALEQFWQRQASVNASLSDWREGVGKGWRPAVIFNSTVAETGEPLLFSTSDLPEQVSPRVNGKRQVPVRQDFRQAYPHLDVPIVTAVRLASSFPYVSPAARANAGGNKDHLIDGGYYDNYGVASAIDWISNAFQHRRQDRRFPRVLFILIKSFPDNQLDDGKERGWFFQSYAPFLGLFNVRTTTQLVRDRLELLQLRERLGKDMDGLPLLQFATFQFPEHEAPLSWKMNGRQVAAVNRQWGQILLDVSLHKKTGDDLVQVRCALLGFAASGSDRCGAVVGKDPW